GYAARETWNEGFRAGRGHEYGRAERYERQCVRLLSWDDRISLPESLPDRIADVLSRNWRPEPRRKGGCRRCEFGRHGRRRVPRQWRRHTAAAAGVSDRQWPERNRGRRLQRRRRPRCRGGKRE